MIEDLILQQALKEYNIALRYRSQRISSWHKNEDLYLQRKKKEIQGRHNILLGEMQGFIDTLLSKIDDAPMIKFTPTDEADTRKAEKVSKAWEKDSSITQGDWAYKDLLGKKQCGLYGRTGYKYFAESDPKYSSNLCLVDVYDLLVDPLAGGEDIEKGKFCGHDNIFKSIYELENSSLYDARQVVLAKLGLSREQIEKNDNELNEKRNRASVLGLTPDKYQSEETLKLCEWYTTYKGTRYLVTFDHRSKQWLRVEKLKEIFTTPEYANGDPLYPLDSWATNPDMFEFWTPSPADQVRETIEAKSLLISQAFDNRMYNNFGMKAYDINAFPNPALLEPRWGGLVPFNSRENNKSIQDNIYEFRYPALGDTQVLYNILDTEKSKNSGITPATQGLAENDKKVGVMEGELAMAADRMGLFNKSYGRFWVKMGKRYLNGLKEHLNEEMAVKMIGEKGVTWDKLVKSDLNTDFDIEIIGANAELSADARLTKQKLTVLQSNIQNPNFNPKALNRKILEIAGFESPEINDLLDTQNFANKEVALQAAEENEKMLKKVIEPNRNADTGHIRKHLDFIRSNNLKPEVHQRIINHMKLEVPIARQNMVENLMYTKASMGALPEIGQSELGKSPEMGQEMMNKLPEENLQPQSLVGNV
jgi:hypothetical protein